MLSLFLATLISIVVCGDSARFELIRNDAPVFKEMYFDQIIDHFNFKSQGNHTYKQRYLITEQYFKEGGPIFFYTGNEGSIDGFQKASGFLTDLAPKFGALVVFAEHRYYGTSMPFGKDSFKGDFIGLLTIEQALADYAYLIQFLQAKYCDEPCPVIAFGGSYGGELAAYARFKYPNLVLGSLAASAPLNWLSGFGDKHGFFQSVTEQFGKSSAACVSRIKEGFAQTRSLAELGKFDEISQKYHTCDPVSQDSLNHLYGWVRNAFTSIAMMNYPYPTDLLGPLPGHPVDAACKMVLDAPNALLGLATAAGVLYNASSVSCFDIFAEFVECADPTGCGLGNDGTAWDYQACTEINLPGGSTNVTDMFPPLPFTEVMRKNYCEKKYGVTPRPDWLDVQYWGQNVSSSSNIIFSNGDLDPWGPGGFHKDISTSLVAVEVVGGAHHFDLRAANPLDPQTVTAAREREAQIIAGWVSQFYSRSHGTKNVNKIIL